MPKSRSEADAIFVFGGDGTVHRHLADIVKLQLPVLVVPTGSGNDFARALKLRSARDSLGAWKKFIHGVDSPQRIDLGLIQPIVADDPRTNLKSSVDQSLREKHYFCCVAGCGLDSEVARLANRLPRWLRGHGGYALALPAALANFAPPRATLSVPQSANEHDSLLQADQPATLVAFANAPAYGHGMRIAPNALLDDGKLDLCLVARVGKLRLLRLFPTVYAGKHLSLPEVQYSQIERMRIETAPPSAIYADGEYVCHTPAEISVVRNALQVISFAVLH